MLFPGDPDFTVGQYGELNYAYVIEAIKKSSELHQRKLYESELPIAQQSALIANQQRDPKKQKTPYKMSDFSLFMPLEDRNLASSHYGSSALELIKRRLYPSWALFCYKELVACADEKYVPGVLAIQCEDAILIHPEKGPGGMLGMLVAKESASNQIRVMTDEHGKSYKVQMPEVGTKFIAEEGVILPLR